MLPRQNKPNPRHPRRASKAETRHARSQTLRWHASTILMEDLSTCRERLQTNDFQGSYVSADRLVMTGLSVGFPPIYIGYCAFLVGRHVRKNVGEDIKLVKNGECENLQNILNEPPDDAIKPYPQRKQLSRRIRNRKKSEDANACVHCRTLNSWTPTVCACVRTVCFLRVYSQCTRPEPVP